jgi:hypothetical protein
MLDLLDEAGSRELHDFLADRESLFIGKAVV